MIYTTFMLLRFTKLKLFGLCLLLGAGLLQGQGTTSRLLGTVVDSSGAPVAGANVQLINEGTAQTFRLETSSSGSYAFESIAVGNYTVQVEAAGFKRFIAKSNVVNIGQPTTVNVTLEVGAVTESIEVESAYEQVQVSTSGNIGNVLSENVIKDLPIVGSRGRNPLDLVLRQPGVVSGANTGGGIHVNGARDRAWNFTIDGIDANETSAGGSNFAPIRTNPDSLAEFKVITSNATAEFGRNSGGQVSLVTKSGTNEVHGQGFWFYRSPRLNASEWQANLQGQGKPQFVQNIFGGSVGGPIVKNKLFYFGNLQRLTARDSAIVNRTVYTDTAKQGIFRYVRGGRNLPAGSAGASVDASGNVVPGTNIGTYNILTQDPERLGADPRIRDLIQRLPAPNNFFGGDGLNTALYTFTALGNERQYDVTMKFDYILNDKNTIYARILFGEQNTLCDRVNGGAPFFAGSNCPVNTFRTPSNLAFNWRTNPTSKITNELVVGRNYFAFDFQVPTADLNAINLTGAPVLVPESLTFGNARKLNTWQIVDNFSYFAGAHTLKGGINFRLASHRDVRGSVGGANITTTANFSRTVNTVDPARFGLPADINTAFDRPNLESSINYMLGRVGTVNRGFVNTGDQFEAQLYNFKALYNEYDFYFQDTWKVTRNLTVDLGLRLEMKMAPQSDPEGRILNPDQAIAIGGAPTSNARWVEGRLFRSDRNNWGPSLGIAYDPFGDGKTVIRSNYRLAYDRLNTFVLSSSVLQNLPGQAQGSTNQAFGQAGGRLRNLNTSILTPNGRPSDFAQPPAFSANTITVVDPNFEMPQTHMWSFGIQRQVARNTVIDVNYIGRRAHNLFGAYNINQVNLTNNGFLDAYNVVAGGGQSPLINQLLGPDPRRRSTETGSDLMRRVYAADIRGNSVGIIAQDISRRLVGGRTLPAASGLGEFFFLNNPQHANTNVIDSNDFSTYHGLQIQVERRMTKGFTAQLGYTWSKSMDTRSFDPTFTTVSGGVNQSGSSTPFDIYNRRGNYAPSDFDRRHALQGYWLYEIPFAANAAKPLRLALADWQVTGALTLTSGRPFTVYSGFNQFSNVISATANCTDCGSFGTTQDRPDGIKWFFDPSEVAAFSNPSAGSIGSSGRNRFYGPRFFNMDFTLMKRIPISERFRVELRADAINVTNTPSFGFPTANLSSATFGRIFNSLTSGSRKVQLGAKIYF
ncbi:MAG: carboxypeptidase regulatory-like domain-containing protein [Bryobacter sp.]|nr:carboxypeptidase regulatory-like domain-containing protein [Bryobacter sp.]